MNLTRFIFALATTTAVSGFATPNVFGQACCGESRMQPVTVCETVPETRYRVEYETISEPREVTSYRQVVETGYREERYRVAKPVTETSYEERRYTVRRPVQETKYEERCVDKVVYETEQQVREERVRVQRPVTETQYREEQYCVQRPVTETQMQQYQYTTMEPVTTMKTEVVDQGCYQDQQVVQQPAYPNISLLPQQNYVNPVNGQTYAQRPGLYWVNTPQVTTQRVWVPNPVTVQRPETTMVARVNTAERPVQVTRMENQMMTRRVPVEVCRMEEEIQVRRVPVTVQKPRVERQTYRVPITVTRYEEQEVVRRVPVERTRYEYEERVRRVPVSVCKTVPETKTVEVQRTVRKLVPYTVERPVTRTFMMRAPIDECCESVSFRAPTRVEIVEPADDYCAADAEVVEEKISSESDLSSEPTPAAEPADERPSLQGDTNSFQKPSLPDLRELDNSLDEAESRLKPLDDEPDVKVEVEPGVEVEVGPKDDGQDKSVLDLSSPRNAGLAPREIIEL
jgi:hypothetical protein